ncbi:TonB family protein [Halopseudomonas phragmitis]|uniref:Protein TonB n=2 Tax=Pseudomonadaceae TaxID=135621 RepID=A0A1V0B1L8_9GAMM|nr:MULTISPECIES: energy transducer TonB [Pseudomonadaceae]AQZ93828.1 hypothetical protein BVH74_03235 [Halopseudomonas phragmitis]RHW19942.1 energy transducer TonB [Pseudomonas jilinensis]
MRLLVSFLGALLVALALFALMLVLIMPPRDNSLPDDELARVSFVRSVSDTQSDSRERQPRQAPEPPTPQPPVTPTPPRPPQPQVDTQVNLNIDLPNISTPLAISSAPSLQNLSAAAEVATPPPAPTMDATPSLSEEVTPLVDIPPNYPQRALAAGIEGEVTLAFTITADGRVDNLRVTHANPPGVFEREARRAAMRWRFAPRRENGQNVAREATKTLYFRLDGGR